MMEVDVNNAFATIEKWRWPFFRNVIAVDVISRMEPFNDERDERMQAERDEHLRLAREQLDILEDAYAADIKRMKEMYEQVAVGMEPEPQASAFSE